jgi:hypothetical protein
MSSLTGLEEVHWKRNGKGGDGQSARLLGDYALGPAANSVFRFKTQM